MRRPRKLRLCHYKPGPLFILISKEDEVLKQYRGGHNMAAEWKGLWNDKQHCLILFNQENQIMSTGVQTLSWDPWFKPRWKHYWLTGWVITDSSPKGIRNILRSGRTRRSGGVMCGSLLFRVKDPSQPSQKEHRKPGW